MFSWALKEVRNWVFFSAEGRLFQSTGAADLKEVRNWVFFSAEGRLFQSTGAADFKESAPCPYVFSQKFVKH